MMDEEREREKETERQRERQRQNIQNLHLEKVKYIRWVKTIFKILL
jgi:hypothetical protein